MPLRPFLPLAARFVVPGIAGGDRQVDDLHAGLRVADLRVLAQVPDQGDFIDAARHAASPTVQIALNRATLAELCCRSQHSAILFVTNSK